MRVTFILDEKGMAKSLIIHGPKEKAEAAKIIFSR
jgi:hypothetical protein